MLYAFQSHLKIMIFSKYSFPTLSDWTALQSTIQDENGNYKDCAVVEIGNICLATNEQGECTNLDPNYAVDIMWYLEQTPTDFNQYEVFPAPVGIHTFSGDDSLYVKRFCEFNPTSPYCVIS